MFCKPLKELIQVQSSVSTLTLWYHSESDNGLMMILSGATPLTINLCLLIHALIHLEGNHFPFQNDEAITKFFFTQQLLTSEQCSQAKL